MKKQKRDLEKLYKKNRELRIRGLAVTVIALFLFFVLVLCLYKIATQGDDLNYCINAYNGLTLKYYSTNQKPDLVWHYNLDNNEYKCSALLCKEENCSELKLSCISCCEKNETH